MQFLEVFLSKAFILQVQFMANNLELEFPRVKTEAHSQIDFRQLRSKFGFNFLVHLVRPVGEKDQVDKDYNCEEEKLSIVIQMYSTIRVVRVIFNPFFRLVTDKEESTVYSYH